MLALVMIMVLLSQVTTLALSLRIMLSHSL
jgi:hypothetical protein